jgi:hypothetical protein
MQKILGYDWGCDSEPVSLSSKLDNIPTHLIPYPALLCLFPVTIIAIWYVNSFLSFFFQSEHKLLKGRASVCLQLIPNTKSSVWHRAGSQYLLSWIGHRMLQSFIHSFIKQTLISYLLTVWPEAEDSILEMNSSWGRGVGLKCGRATFPRKFLENWRP